MPSKSTTNLNEQKWVSFMGDFSMFSTFLNERKTKSPWILLKIINVFLRSFSQAILCNNPVSGFIIFVALIVAHPFGTMAASLTTVLAMIVAVLIRQPCADISNGLMGFNPALLGIVTTTYIPTMYTNPSPTDWILLGAGTVFCVYLSVSINTILAKLSLPGLTLPFNVAQYMLLVVCQTQFNDAAGQVHNANADVETNLTWQKEPILYLAANKTDHLDWGETFSGMILSAGQVYGVNSVAGSALIYAAILIYSPIMAGFSFLGALLGTICGVLYSPAHTDYFDVYNGIWGYNSLLCGAATGGLFYTLNGHTAAAAVMCVLFSPVLQLILRSSLNAGFSVQTLPFCISAYLFLSLSAHSDGVFPKPTTITFPEKHRCDSKENQSLPSQAEMLNDCEPQCSTSKILQPRR